MKLRILGCSGGIGAGQRTTSLLLGDHTLIDAGTGVGDLSQAELCAIDHIFVTHAHLDHIVSIPFLIDTVGRERSRPIVVHALQEVIDALKTHIFNWVIWPDFAKIPNADNPLIRYQTFQLSERIAVHGCTITPLPADHVVPAVAFQIDSGTGSAVFTGDTFDHEPLWQAVNQIGNLRHLIVETAFPDKDEELARIAKHLHPRMLAKIIKKLATPAQIHVTHLKPDSMDIIMQEIGQALPATALSMLKNNDILEF